MKFKKIRFRNFLSFGNNWTEVDLDINQTVLVSGSNGQGKSALLESIYFAFTGKSYRNIPKPKLVNNINKKHLMVELTIEHNGSIYVIRRGIQPNVFEILKDGSVLDEDSNIRDYQKQLETILGIDAKTFKQTIMLSSRYYVPFLDLNPKDKRHFIENIFSLKMFSDMNDYLKRKLQVTKLNVKGLEKDIEHVISSIRVLEDINEKQMKQNDVQKDNLKKEIKELNNLNDEHRISIDSYNEKLLALNVKLEQVQKKTQKKNDITNAIDLIRYKINTHQDKIKFFTDNDVCETCEQKIDKDFKNLIIAHETGSKVKKDEKLAALKNALNYINEYNKKSLKLVEGINQKLKSVISLNSDIRTNDYIVSDKKKSINSLNEVTVINQEDFDKLNVQLDTYQKECNDLIKYQKYISVVVELISEKGIKKYIIAKYIPILNTLLNGYLQKFEAPYSVMFNEELDEEIIARGYENLGYLNLSSGEKQRLDTALVFSFLELCRMKNSINTNCLFIDEILDMSLDQSGIDSILRIFEGMKQQGYTIFVVSHKENIAENFNKELKISKKQFSEIEEV